MTHDLQRTRAVTGAITAGGVVETAFAREIGTAVKAMAPLGGRRLIDAAITAARGCGVDTLTLVGGDEVGSYCRTRVDVILPAVADGRENLETALRSARADEPFLLLTSDLPFITEAALAQFVQRAQGAAVALPLASPHSYTTAYPGAPAHVTAVGRDRVASGSVFYFAPGAAERAIAIARDLFERRKSLLRMASLLDLPLLCRFLLGRLTVGSIERYAATKFGLQARAVRDSDPALCYDIDTLEDYRYALERLLANP